MVCYALTEKDNPDRCKKLLRKSKAANHKLQKRPLFSDSDELGIEYLCIGVTATYFLSPFLAPPLDEQESPRNDMFYVEKAIHAPERSGKPVVPVYATIHGKPTLCDFDTMQGIAYRGSYGICLFNDNIFQWRLKLINACRLYSGNLLQSLAINLNLLDKAHVFCPKFFDFVNL
jgi:hypothetical protein